MRITTIVLAAFALASGAAQAADNSLLIQIESNGKFRVWHTEGENMLNEDETQVLAEHATPEGSAPMPTSAGMASARRTKNGVVVRLHDKTTDNTLLLDRDDCGGVKLWHADGATTLPDDVLTELVISALPNGGERLTVGDQYARAYTTKLGVIALLWKPKKK